jgi:hypothetical protein
MSVHPNGSLLSDYIITPEEAHADAGFDLPGSVLLARESALKG